MQNNVLNNGFTANDLSKTQVAFFTEMHPATIKTEFDGFPVSGIQIDFHDPWYVSDANNTQPDDFITVTSPYSPTGKYNMTSGGVFLKENTTFDPQKPIYSVRTPLNRQITIGGKTYTGKFINWYTTGASTQQVDANPLGYDQKAVVFNSTGAEVTAKYKASQLSSDASAYTNNSQRKIVRTMDGWLHQTYVSMNHVWIEHSSNNGTSWFIGNNGQPLDNGEGKCPSIDWFYQNNQDCFVVAFQQKEGNNYSIQYKIYGKNGGNYTNTQSNCFFRLKTDHFSA